MSPITTTTTTIAKAAPAAPPPNVLKRALGPYADALVPTQTPIPTDHDEVILSSGRLPSPRALTPARAMEQTRYTAHFDVGVQQGRGHRVMIPSYGAVHCDVRPNTRMHVAVDMYNGPPSTVVEFTPPVWIPDPLQFLGSQIIHTLCGLSLEAVELRDDKSIYIRGHIKGMFGLINKSLVKSVKAAPSEGSEHDHVLWSLVKGAGTAIILAVPRVLGALADSVGLTQRPDDSFVQFWDSIFPLLEPGVMDGHGAFEVSRPLVVSNDLGDMVFDTQEVMHHFQAEVVPSAGGVQLRIAKGSEINSKTLAMQVSGDLMYDGNSLRGDAIDIDVQHLQVDAFVSNGTPGATLLPLHIDSSYGGKTRSVAQVQGNFAYGNGLNVNAQVDFCMPAQMRDVQRDVHLPQGDLHIDRADLGLLIKGRAKVGDPGASGDAVTTNDSDASLQVRVDQLDIQGRLRARPLPMFQAETPFHLFSDATERPVDLQAAYRAESLGRAGEVGGSLRFYLPMRFDAPGRVNLRLPQATKVEATRAALRAHGKVVFGNQVKDPIYDAKGDAILEIDELAGTVSLGENHQATDLGLALIDQPGSLRLAQPSQLHAQAQLLHRRGGADFPVQGSGDLTLTARTPDDLGLHIQMPGGPVHILQAHAQVRSPGFTFAVTEGQPEFAGTVTVDHRLTEAGSFTADVSVKDGKSAITPQPVVHPDPTITASQDLHDTNHTTG